MFSVAEILVSQISNPNQATTTITPNERDMLTTEHSHLGQGLVGVNAWGVWIGKSQQQVARDILKPIGTACAYLAGKYTWGSFDGASEMLGLYWVLYGELGCMRNREGPDLPRKSQSHLAPSMTLSLE